MSAPTIFRCSVVYAGGGYILSRNGISMTCDLNELDKAKEEFSSYYWNVMKENLRKTLKTEV